MHRPSNTMGGGRGSVGVLPHSIRARMARAELKTHGLLSPVTSFHSASHQRRSTVDSLTALSRLGEGGMQDRERGCRVCHLTQPIANPSAFRTLWSKCLRISKHVRLQLIYSCKAFGKQPPRRTVQTDRI